MHRISRDIVFIPELLRWVVFLLITGISPGIAAVTGAYVVTKTVVLNDTILLADATDESGILVADGGNLSITNATISTSGASSSSDSSSFYGLNAGILAVKGGTITTLSNCAIITTGKGANGVFAYGSATITMENDTINCSGAYAHGIMCSGGGTITVKNCYAKTTNSNGSVIATDKGSGTITITGGYYESTGKSSAGIYSTGEISAFDATFKCSQTAGCIIEGGNNIILNGCIVEGFNKGAKLFQSMSGDAEGTTPVLKMTDGSFSTKNGPLLYGTNANSTVELINVIVSNPSDTLIYADSASKGGGLVNLIARKQVLSGIMAADRYSSFSGTLLESSHWTGNANTAKTAKKVSITLDATSTWTVTATSHVTSIASAAITGTTVSNIIGNGNNVYYSPASSSSLDGRTYALIGGGYLLPEGATVDIVTPRDQSCCRKSDTPAATLMGTVLFGKGYNNTKKKIALFDIRGRLIAPEKVVYGNAGVYYDIGVSRGMYIVKIRSLP